MSKTWVSLALLLSLNSALQPASALAAESTLPEPLRPWQPHIEQILSHFMRTNISAGRLQEAVASSQTQKQKFLPSLTAGMNINRGKTSLFDDGKEISSRTSANDLQLNITLRQNVYNGGTDLARLNLAQTREQLAELKLIQAQRSFVRSWLKDIAGINHQLRILGYHTAALERAKALNQLAARKEASGFLGRRDLLDSQRELLRVEQEKQMAQSTLREFFDRHRSFFGLEKPESVDRRPFEFLRQTRLASLASDTSAAQEVARVVDSLMPVLMAEIDKKITDAELKLSTKSRFTPRLDALAQANHTQRLSNSNETNTVLLSQAIQSDASGTWTLAITGEISLNPSVSFGAVEESRQRLASAEMLLTKSRDENKLALENTLLRLRQVRDRKKSAQELVEITTQLRDKNHRLFEAGELSIDRLIASEQDLNRDKISLAVVEFDELKLTIDASLSEIWLLEPSSSNTQVQP